MLVRPVRTNELHAIGKLAVDATRLLMERSQRPAEYLEKILRAKDFLGLHEIFVAEEDQCLVGCVSFLASSKPKPDYFTQSMPLIRNLFVPDHGTKKAVCQNLLEVCIWRAQKDGNLRIALHLPTLPSDEIAVAQRMQFAFDRMAPDTFGVPYQILERDCG